MLFRPCQRSFQEYYRLAGSGAQTSDALLCGYLQPGIRFASHDSESGFQKFKLVGRLFTLFSQRDYRDGLFS
jgi:hypothetical protein